MIVDLEGSVLAPATDIVYILDSHVILDALGLANLLADHDASNLHLVLS